MAGYEGPERRDIDREIREAVAVTEARFTQIVREAFADLRLELNEHRQAQYPHPSSQPDEQGRVLWDERNVRKGEGRVYRQAMALAVSISSVIAAIATALAVLLTHHGP